MSCRIKIQDRYPRLVYTFMGFKPLCFNYNNCNKLQYYLPYILLDAYLLNTCTIERRSYLTFRLKFVKISYFYKLIMHFCSQISIINWSFFNFGTEYRYYIRYLPTYIFSYYHLF